jgi:hypothetical protein
MPRRALSDRALIAIAFTLMILLATIGAVVAPPADTGGGGPSSFSTAARGTKAVFITLGQLGYGIERSYEPVSTLAADPATTVIIFADPEIAPSSQDRQALQAFMNHGGLVIATGVGGADLLGLTDAKAAISPDVEAVERYAAAAPSVLTAGAPEIALAREVQSQALPLAYVPIYATRTGEPVVGTAAIGAGRAIWMAGGAPLSNADAASAGNFQMLRNALGKPGGRRILWDEYYHGHTRSLWSYVASTPMPWVFAQFGVIAIAALITYSRRSGPVQPRYTDARTSPMEFVETMAALYRRAGRGTAAVAVVRARLCRLLVAACGLPADAPDAVIASAAAAKFALDQDAVAALLAETGRAAFDYDLTPADALTLTRRMQEIGCRTLSPR